MAGHATCPLNLKHAQRRADLPLPNRLVRDVQDPGERFGTARSFDRQGKLFLHGKQDCHSPFP